VKVYININASPDSYQEPMPYFLFPPLYINPYLSSIKKTIMGLKKNFRSGVPDPLVLALLLTFLTMILALALGTNPGAGIAGVADVLSYWVKGFWDLLTFSMQMVLILLLGYMLALSPIHPFKPEPCTGRSCRYNNSRCVRIDQLGVGVGIWSSFR